MGDVGTGTGPEPHSGGERSLRDDRPTGCDCQWFENQVCDVCQGIDPNNHALDTASASLFSDPVFLARRFHEVYEELAPTFGYETREETKVAWDQLPMNNRMLMVATCSVLLSEGGRV